MKRRRKDRNGQLLRWSAVLLRDGEPVRDAAGRVMIITAYTAKQARHALKAFAPGAIEVRPA